MLSSHNFSYDCNLAMIAALNDKFNLGARLGKNKGKCVIIIDETELFISIVNPYIFDCKRYKKPRFN